MYHRGGDALWGCLGSKGRRGGDGCPGAGLWVVETVGRGATESQRHCFFRNPGEGSPWPESRHPGVSSRLVPSLASCGGPLKALTPAPEAPLASWGSHPVTAPLDHLTPGDRPPRCPRWPRPLTDGVGRRPQRCLESRRWPSWMNSAGNLSLRGASGPNAGGV